MSDKDLPVVPDEHRVSTLGPEVSLNYIHPGLSLSQIISIVRAYWKSSLLITILVACMTVLVVQMWPRTYEATTTMMVNYEVNDPLNGEELPIGMLGNYIATQVELMGTKEVLLPVVERLNLTSLDEYTAGYENRRGTLEEWAAERVQKNLDVYQGQFGSQLIYINYTAKDARQAADVANEIAAVYQEQDRDRSTGPPAERAERYAAQLQELKEKVEVAQQQVTEFNQSNGLINAGTRTNVDVNLLSTLEQRLFEATNERRAAQARAGDQSSADAVLNSNLVQSLKTNLAAYESDMAVLKSQYSDSHPEVRQLQLQIDAARSSLDAELESYNQNASADLEAALEREESLREAVESQNAKVLAVGQLHDEAAKYLLELESAESVYKRALEAYDQFMFASTGNSSNVGVVSRATPPVRATSPSVVTNLALGFIAAAMLGIGGPLSYGLFNRRVRCRDDLERDHGIPALVEFDAMPMTRSSV